MKQVMCLKESTQARYAEISCKGGVWYGQNIIAGVHEALPKDSWELVPLDRLMAPLVDIIIEKLVTAGAVEAE